MTTVLASRGMGLTFNVEGDFSLLNITYVHYEGPESNRKDCATNTIIKDSSQFLVFSGNYKLYVCRFVIKSNMDLLILRGHTKRVRCEMFRLHLSFLAHIVSVSFTTSIMALNILDFKWYRIKQSKHATFSIIDSCAIKRKSILVKW